MLIIMWTMLKLIIFLPFVIKLSNDKRWQMIFRANGFFLCVIFRNELTHIEDYNYRREKKRSAFKNVMLSEMGDECISISILK